MTHWRVQVVFRAISGLFGIVLIGLGAGLTWWAALTGHPLSGVGIGGIFVVGVFLALAGLSGMVPSSLSLGKDGLVVQLVAETSSQLKKSAQTAAQQLAADPQFTGEILQAKSPDDADKVAKKIVSTVLGALPTTADLTRQALDKLRS
jgi:hypothetical protein